MATFKLILGLTLAGGAGTLARYGLTAALDKRYPHALFGTFAVNALGCFMFGLILAWAASRYSEPDHPARIILLTGFIGAFTTFSTYAYLSSNLITKQQWLLAAGHVLAHNVVGIALLVLGSTLGAKLAG